MKKYYEFYLKRYQFLQLFSCCWKGIIDSFSDLTPTLEINTFSTGIQLPVEMEVNLIENENQYIDSDDLDTHQCQVVG